MSYQSFLEKGSTLKQIQPIIITASNKDKHRSKKEQQKKEGHGIAAYVFFLPPFFPLEIRLFFLQGRSISKRATEGKEEAEKRRRELGGDPKLTQPPWLLLPLPQPQGGFGATRSEGGRENFNLETQALL